MGAPARRSDPEWMDRPGNSREDLEGALADIRIVNRWLGGTRVLLEALRPHLLAPSPGTPLEILDVGTGGADLPIEMVRLARRAGREIRITAIDTDPTTADIAGKAARDFPEIRVVVADAFALPFPPRSFDLVTASLFLHHFGHDAAARLIAGFRLAARRAVVVNDLRRHRVPWAFIALVSRLTGRSRMFRHDAPLSVLRGFTDAELASVASESGSRRFVLERRWPFRLVLTVASEEPS